MQPVSLETPKLLQNSRARTQLWRKLAASLNKDKTLSWEEKKFILESIWGDAPEYEGAVTEQLAPEIAEEVKPTNSRAKAMARYHVLNVDREELGRYIAFIESDPESKAQLELLQQKKEVDWTHFKRVRRTQPIDAPESNSYVEKTPSGCYRLEGISVVWTTDLYSKNKRRAAGATPGAEHVDVATRLRKIRKELTELPVRPDTITNVISVLERDIENAGRPHWLTPREEQQPAFLGLTAPLFLKAAWKDKIKNGKISRSLVLDYDEGLVKAFDVYVSQRRSRSQDAGDAKGVTMVADKRKNTLRKTLSL
jgi:hypothetical protein